MVVVGVQNESDYTTVASLDLGIQVCFIKIENPRFLPAALCKYFQSSQVEFDFIYFTEADQVLVLKDMESVLAICGNNPSVYCSPHRLSRVPEQPLVTVPAGYNSSSFTTKLVSITSAFTGNVSIVFKFTWASQPTLQQIGYVKNISVCNGASSPRISNTVTTHSMAISPNPSKEEFTLNAEKSIELLFITDNQGRQVYKASHLPEGTPLEFGRNFTNGIYTISVKYTDGSEETLKVLKAK